MESIEWKDRRPCVYKLIFPNGKAYIGQTFWPRRRLYEHKSQKRKSGTALREAIAQYGWSDVRTEILAEAEESELDRVQIEMIDKHGTLVPDGLNVQRGGNPSRKWDPAKKAAWLAKQPAAWDKALATKLAKREDKLAMLAPEVADELRARLDQTNERSKALRHGAVLPDGRLGPSLKRQKTWELKQIAKEATMTPEEIKKYRAKREYHKKYAQTYVHPDPEKRKADMKTNHQKLAKRAQLKDAQAAAGSSNAVLTP